MSIVLSSAPTRFVWEAAGRPAPVETDGEPIAPTDWKAEVEKRGRALHAASRAALVSGDARAHRQAEEALASLSTSPVCACCGEPATHRMADAISDSFTTTANESRARPYSGDGLCAGCVWAHKNLALRCAMWFATPAGIWFQGTWPVKGMAWTRPRAFDVLLHPPPPPFVAAYPRAGVDHGGEDALERTMLVTPALTDEIRFVRERIAAAAAQLLAATPASVKAEEAKKAAMRALVTLGGWPAAPPIPPWPSPVDWPGLVRELGRWRWEPWWRWAAWPLTRLQSKHTAIYVRIAHRSDRYPLQVDDASGFELDVATWRACRAVVAPLLADIRRQGVGATEAITSLTLLQMPLRYRISMRGWRDATTPLRGHYQAPWWPTFLSLLPMPDVTPTRPRAAK